MRCSAGKRHGRRRHFGQLLPCLLATVAACTVVAQAAPVATVTTLNLSSATVASPAAVTLSASVSAGGAPVTAGTVTFCDASVTLCEDAAIVGKAQLNAGTAQLKFIPAIGTHTYKAVFQATATAAGSTSATQTLTVAGLWPTGTSISASGNPDGYTLTATVVGYANHPPVLAGTVSFEDTSNGNFAVGTAALGAPTYAEQFVPATGSPVNAGNEPSATGIADFNGDGKPDVAVLNAGDNTINILLGNGDGTFVQGTLIEGVGTTDCIYQDQPSNCSLAVGDVNNDGKADMAVTMGGDDTIIVLLGNGDGTFVQANGSPITVGTFPEAVKIADVNNDGSMDLVVANAKDNTVSILLGHGNGTFTAASGSPVPVGNFPFFLAVADFNGDGNLDFASTNQDDNTLSVFLGAGNGTFTEATGSPIPSLNYNPGPVVSADFNGDGVIDLAIANFTPANAGNTGNVVILLGKGDGTFTQSPTSPISVGVDPFALAVADFDQDGHTDLAVDNYGQIEQPQTQTLSILLGDGKGGFTALGSDIVLGNSPNDLGVADFNGDGATDFAIPELADGQTTILLNQFTQTETATASGITISGTGTHYVDAVYPGNTSFAPSTSSTVPLQGQTVPTTLTLSANPIEQMISMPITLVAQLIPTSAETPTAQPTGIVTFYDQSLGGLTLGTAAMGANFQAALTFNTSVIGPGTHIITASYAGDQDFLASSSGNLSVQVDELMMTRVGNDNTNILPGATVVYTLQVTPQVASTFLYDVNFSTAGLPAGAVATFSPVNLSAGGKVAQVKMTVTTVAGTQTAQGESPFSRLPIAFALLLPLCGAKRVRRRLQQLPHGLGMVILTALCLAAAAGLSGCSGAGLFAERKTPYAITVTATEGTVQRPIQVPLAIY